MKRGLFITLEGTDGVGKTTQARLLKTWLMKQGRKVKLTREPGGGPLAEKIRGLLLDPKMSISDLSELFLYEAARAHHVEKVILPALKKQHIVICDRFADATVAYQGFARRLSLKTITLLNHLATGGLKPHLTLFLDLPPKIGLKQAIRLKPQHKKGDRLEQEGLRFQERVYKGYRNIWKKDPRRVKRVPVQDTAANTQKLIRQVVSKNLLS